MPTYNIGQGYKLFFGLGASAPTTPTDPENSTVLKEVGDLGDTLTITNDRANVERRGRADPNARYIHPGDRTESFSCDVNFDLDGNTGFDDVKTAYGSDTDGTGASGNIGYFAISDNVATHPVWHGQAAPSSKPYDLGRQSVIASSLSFDTNGDMTEASHA